MKKRTQEELIEYYSKPLIPVWTILGGCVFGGLFYWAAAEIIKSILF